MRKREEASPPKPNPPPPEERNIPIPGSGVPAGKVHCSACSEWVEVGDCSARADGVLECSSCGAPIKNAGTSNVPAPSPPKPAEARPVSPPPAPPPKPAEKPAEKPERGAPALGLPVMKLHVSWGSARCPVDRFNAFQSPQLDMTRDLAEGEDPVKAGAEMLVALETIADATFEKQYAWYVKKLNILGYTLEK